MKDFNFCKKNDMIYKYKYFVISKKIFNDRKNGENTEKERG